MKIQWFGHATFLVTASNGLRLITDPYVTNARFTYGDINDAADIVTVSHEHGDHNNTAAVKGNPVVLRSGGEVKGIKFRAIPTSHDATGGKERGSNAVFCFEIDGVKVCHLGDLGHPLSAQQAAEIGKVDVLLIPVGGYYTIDAAAATQVIVQLKPSVAIPMHFKTEKYSGPIVGIDDFLKGKTNVTRLDASEAEFKTGSLPAKTQIMVLKPAK